MKIVLLYRNMAVATKRNIPVEIIMALLVIILSDWFELRILSNAFSMKNNEIIIEGNQINRVFKNLSFFIGLNLVVLYNLRN